LDRAGPRLALLGGEHFLRGLLSDRLLPQLLLLAGLRLALLGQSLLPGLLLLLQLLLFPVVLRLQLLPLAGRFFLLHLFLLHPLVQGGLLAGLLLALLGLLALLSLLLLLEEVVALGALLALLSSAARS
jgi:hypothetical protein